MAYQVEEGGYCGRSFEEAFIYANVDWLKANHAALTANARPIKKSVEKGLPGDGWDLSAELGKVDFALDLISHPGWSTPKYIQDGLVWLAQYRAAP